MRRPLLSYDAHGTPGLFAPDPASAYFGIGYLHGLHRPLQSLLLATAARARLSELIAPLPQLVELDARVLRLRLRELGDREAQRLSEPTAHWLDAYLEGFREGLLRGGQPFELRLLLTRLPRPDRATVLSGLMLSAYLGLAEGQERMERGLVELLRAGADPALLGAMLEQEAPTLDATHLGGGVPLGFASPLSAGVAVGGSNAWAVTGTRTRSGKAMLCGDPHLQVNQLPGLFFELRARVGDEVWLGATIPGLPGIAVGRTKRLAWSGTFSVVDNVDAFVEPPRGAWRRREERLRRRVGAPLSLTFFDRDDASLVAHDTRSAALSVRWAGTTQRAAAALHAYLHLPLCGDIDAAVETLRGAETFQLHYVLADSSGEVARLTVGRVPKREGNWRGLFPRKDAAWRGFYTGAELPLTRTREGFVVSANEPSAATDGTPLATLAQPGYRLQRISALLDERHDHDVASMQALQLDVVSLQARALIPKFVLALGEGHPLARRLLAWSCSYDASDTTAPVFQRCYRTCLAALAPELGGAAFEALLATSELPVWLCAALDRVLLGAWEGERGERLRAALLSAAVDSEAPWGEVQRYTARHMVLGGLPGVFKLDRGPLALPGSVATVRQGNVLMLGKNELAVGPAYRFICDFGDDGAWTALAGGIDGSPMSGSYDVWLAPWQAGLYHRLLPPSGDERRSARPL